MKQITLEIDTLPLTKNPLFCKDYVGRQILGAVYERLVNNYNCTLKRGNNIFYIKLLNPKINIDNYIETINFHRNDKNKSPFSHFFKYLNEIKKISNKEMEIVISSSCYFNFQDVLEASFFVPMKNGKVINNGPYSFIQKETNNLEYNQDYWNNSIERYEINFLLNSNSERSKEFYEKKIVTMTSNTHFNFNMFEKYENTKDINILNSKLIFLLEVKDIKLKKLIINNLSDFFQNKVLSKLLIPIEQIEEKSEKQKNNFNEINIVYSDFYPNSIIIKELTSILSKYNILVKTTKIIGLSDFVDLDKSKFDITLHLIAPSIKDENSLIPFGNRFKEKNKYSLLSKYTNFLPIFRGKSIFLKDPNLNIEMDELGQIMYEKIRWVGKNELE